MASKCFYHCINPVFSPLAQRQIFRNYVGRDTCQQKKLKCFQPLKKRNWFGCEFECIYLCGYFLLSNACLSFREQWWRSGESFLPMWPGFDDQIRRHLWVEFVGSLLFSERFSPGFSDFPPSAKKSTFD